MVNNFVVEFSPPLLLAPMYNESWTYPGLEPTEPWEADGDGGGCYKITDPYGRQDVG